MRHSLVSMGHEASRQDFPTAETFFVQLPEQLGQLIWSSMLSSLGL